MLGVHKSKIKKCDICDSNATCLCFSCISYFCESCFKFIHDKQKNSFHKKESLDPYILINLKCQNHPINPISLICIDEKELCCSHCVYKNLHEGHKVLELSDEDSLSQENLSIDSEIEAYNDIIQKIIDIKMKIENEINKINKLYDEKFEDIKKYFKKKYEDLSKEKNDDAFNEKKEILLKDENEMIEKLENEVTKAKEKLENYLSQANNEIRLNEKMKKGINKFKNEKNWGNNINKILLYISDINKNKKVSEKLNQKCMKSLKFGFDEEQSKIIYEEYYFNGISIPKDIQFKDISYDSLNITWKINHIQNINIDNEKIKYRVEMRKDGEQFKKVYEGKDLKCSITNLDMNTKYELRICSIYKDYIGPWSNILNVKTKIYDYDFYNNIIKGLKYNKIQSGKFDQIFGDHHYMYSGHGDRTYTKHINFKEKYENIPEVNVSLVGFDMNKKKNARLKIYTENIAPEGFDIKIFTWWDTSIYAVNVSWIAYGK